MTLLEGGKSVGGLVAGWLTPGGRPVEAGVHGFWYASCVWMLRDLESQFAEDCWGGANCALYRNGVWLLDYTRVLHAPRSLCCVFWTKVSGHDLSELTCSKRK